MGKRRVFLVLVACFFVVVFAVETLSQTGGSSRTTLPLLQHLKSRSSAENVPELGQIDEPAHVKYDKKIAKLFKVHWLQINYNGQTVKGPKLLAEPGRSVGSRAGSLLCEIEVLDPEKVLGIYGQALVDELTDSQGRKIDVSRLQPYPDGMRYQRRSQRMKMERPSKLVLWEGRTRTRLGLGLKERHRPTQVLDPTTRIGIQLDVGTPEWVQGEIGRIKGHFYALMAESFEHVDVPFKPSSDWVRVTPEIEVRVAAAVPEGRHYSYDIRVRPEQDTSKKYLTVEDRLPQRMIVGECLLGDDEKFRPHPVGERLPLRIGGKGKGGSTVSCPKTKIRYVIAVNPTHYKVPFELKNIPLPASSSPKPELESIRDFKLSPAMAEEIDKYEQPRLSREEKKQLWEKEKEIAGKYLQEMYALEVNRQQWEIIKRKLENVERLRARASRGAGFEMYRLPGATGPELPDPRYMHEWGWKWPERWKSRAPTELSEGEKIVKELIELIDSKSASSEQLQQKMGALRDYRRRMRVELEQAMDDLREGLTVRQQAALSLMGWFNDGTE